MALNKFTGSTLVVVSTAGRVTDRLTVWGVAHPGPMTDRCGTQIRMLYSQRPHLGHVVEAGQRDEGDVVVVEGAETEETEGKKRQQCE